MVVKTFFVTTYPGNEDISLGHLTNSTERVLHNTHDGLVGLGRDDHTRHGRQVVDLGAGLQGLGQVQVHLVSVKVSVVWSRYTVSK